MHDNIKSLLKNQIHSHIEHLVNNEKISFLQHAPFCKHSYKYIDTYRIWKIKEYLDVYRIYDYNRKQSVDLHFIMQIDDTNVKIQETDTEFAKQIYKQIKLKYLKQNVK
jgi:hypothetical protein